MERTAKLVEGKNTPLHRHNLFFFLSLASPLCASASTRVNNRQVCTMSRSRGTEDS